MAVPNHQHPTQQKKEKDECEWTTLEQKAHLLSKQGEYNMARENKHLWGWLTIELRTYIDLFPTEPVTVKENINYPGWTLEAKRLQQEKVSNLRLNGNYETHHWHANRELRRGLKTIVILQPKRREGRERSSNTKTNLKNSVMHSPS